MGHLSCCVCHPPWNRRARIVDWHTFTPKRNSPLHPNIAMARSLLRLQSFHTKLSPWVEERTDCSPTVVNTASMLLERMKLPKDTTMAYMAACGGDFQCLRCNIFNEIYTMTWPEFVTRSCEYNCVPPVVHCSPSFGEHIELTINYV